MKVVGWTKKASACEQTAVFGNVRGKLSSRITMSDPIFHSGRDESTNADACISASAALGWKHWIWSEIYPNQIYSPARCWVAVALIICIYAATPAQILRSSTVLYY